MSSPKESYIDFQRLARQYSIGESVRLPKQIQGLGRVTAVLDQIGFIDVETIYGNLRFSVEDLEKAPSEDTSHLLDTSSSTWERDRSRRIASSYYNDRLRKVVHKAVKLREQGFSEMETYDFIFSRHASKHSDNEIKEAVSVAYPENTKVALYWRAKGRRYVPTTKEISEGVFHCPRCKTELEQTHYKKKTKLYACRECLWLICPDELLGKDEEPKSLEKKNPIDFFRPNDPLLKSLHGGTEEDE